MNHNHNYYILLFLGIIKNKVLATEMDSWKDNNGIKKGEHYKIKNRIIMNITVELDDESDIIL